uniref:Uncharacterized protein n=1 Tax=Candidatus Kentrum sp. TC TaxID=2126339 RepID=A0A450YW84_9GAMM|nr:MAG: hypothetical protein BECKTC1821E_GA0114239_105424 [Candidatus Kentron sp. TC]
MGAQHSEARGEGILKGFKRMARAGDGTMPSRRESTREKTLGRAFINVYKRPPGANSVEDTTLRGK